MASIWKGALVFGLVNVQVKVHPATQDKDVSFRQVHAEDGGRIRYQRRCDVCGEVVPFSDISKAYEAPDGQTVVVTEEDLEQLPAGRSREIDVLEFVPSDQVDPIRFERCYFLEPDPTAVRPYVLLREALRNTERTAIVKVALRNKTRLAALRVYDDVIVLQTMLWDDEIRPASFPSLDEQAEAPRKNELAMAASLISTMEADFDPTEYTDEYREQMLELLTKKLESGEDVIEVEAGEDDTAKPSGKVVDLMAALQESIERGKARQAERSDADEDRPKKKSS